MTPSTTTEGTVFERAVEAARREYEAGRCKTCGVSAYGYTGCDCSFPEWRPSTEEERVHAIVRAVLAAIMEPDVPMFEAAWREAQTVATEAGGAVDRDAVVHVVDRYWQAMLSSIIREGE